MGSDQMMMCPYCGHAANKYTLAQLLYTLDCVGCGKRLTTEYVPFDRRKQTELRSKLPPGVNEEESE